MIKIKNMINIIRVLKEKPPEYNIEFNLTKKQLATKNFEYFRQLDEYNERRAEYAVQFVNILF